MSYPNEPTIDESINQFFVFIKDYSEREDLDESKENLEAFENVKTFIEEAYEVAFGEDALHREFHPDEVIEELKTFSDNALKYEEGEL
tara:strand:+ start:434 stop:697 length:264 start_codon:yes stop_codon:yes gene_type:complete